MKVVLDTNVIISGLGWPGRERELLLMAASNRFELILSFDIVKEVIEVLQRGKFRGLDSKKILRFINILIEISTVVVPKKHHEVIEGDPDDNKILDCAVEAKADYIVSGDNHLLKLKKYRVVKIIRPSDFEKIVRSEDG